MKRSWLVLVGLPLVALAQTGGYPKSVNYLNIPDGGLPVTGSVNSTIQLPDGGTQIVQVEGRGGDRCSRSWTLRAWTN